MDSLVWHGSEIRAASSRGILHRAYNTPRQDCYGIAAVGETLLLSVCDGVGSLERSHLAAHWVCEHAPVLIEAARTDRGINWAEVFARLSGGLAELEKSLQPANESPARVLATTVLLGRLSPPDAGSGRVGVELAWIGDSEPYFLRADGWQRLRSDAESLTDRDDDVVQDSRAVNQTSALPSRHTDRYHLVRAELAASDALLLMSDGVGKPLGWGAGMVGQALAEWWAEPPSIGVFAEQVSFARRGFMDDRTVVAVWIGSAAANRP